MRRDAGFSRYFCSNGNCTLSTEIEIDPNLDPDSREFVDLLKIPMSDLDRDVTGHYWCKRPPCHLRYNLIQWGATHKWPAVDFPPYALAHGQDMWLVTAMMGDEARVNALASSLGIIGQEAA